MNNIIIDTALDIKGFNHLAELIEVINKKTCIARSNEKRRIVSDGLWLILLELEDDTTLQRSTLLSTMLNVRKVYGIKTKFRHTAQQLNAITLAIAHVREVLRLKRLITDDVRVVVNTEPVLS